MWILTEERLKTILKIKEAVELAELWKPGQGLWLREKSRVWSRQVCHFC